LLASPIPVLSTFRPVRGFIVLGLLVILAGCGAAEQQEVDAVIRASDAA
jgi:hypothetical protein